MILQLEKELDLEGRAQNLIAAAGQLSILLEDLQLDDESRFRAIVYFDEAHTLNVQGSSNRYFGLMRVLNQIVQVPIFFVFLSTNTSLHSFSPTKELYPSARVQTSMDLIPPFFELPFDAFCEKFTEEAEKKGMLTLDGVCQIGQMSKFGRPM